MSKSQCKITSYFLTKCVCEARHKAVLQWLWILLIPGEFGFTIHFMKPVLHFALRMIQHSDPTVTTCMHQFYLQNLRTICLGCWASVGLCISPSSYPQSWGRLALHHGMVACNLLQYLHSPKNTFRNVINHNCPNVNYTGYTNNLRDSGWKRKYCQHHCLYIEHWSLLQCREQLGSISDETYGGHQPLL